MALPSGYRLRRGSPLDRSLLVKFMQRTYAELQKEGSLNHLARTVDQYLSTETPIWWVEVDSSSLSLLSPSFLGHPNIPIACLWLGTAIDQLHGDRHAYIFLLYVAPEHRRRGIGTTLMQQAEAWAKQRGDRQIGLQVFQTNASALRLYGALGYQPQSLWLVKPL